MTARDDLLAIPDAMLRDGRIAQAALVWMDFQGGAKRWWTGFGNLSVGGYTWQGIGDLIGISEIKTSYQVSAEQVVFTVAATPEMLGLALDARNRVRDRSVIVYLQMFANATVSGVTVGGGEILTGDPIGSPMSLYSGSLQRMPWSATGPQQRTIRIEAEGRFFRRNAAPRGWWNDRDQQSRWPGDRGFERLPLYAGSYETRWRG